MLHVQVSTAQAACGIQADQGEAHSHWLAAAAVSGPHQSAAFAKLGLWYATVKTDLPRARSFNLFTWLFHALNFNESLLSAVCDVVANNQ